jgi:hypothetical protein
MARLMMELQQLIGSKGQRGVSPPLVVAELNLVDTGCEQLDDRAYLAPAKWRVRDIFQQRDDR